MLSPESRKQSCFTEKLYNFTQCDAGIKPNNINKKVRWKVMREPNVDNTEHPHLSFSFTDDTVVNSVYTCASGQCQCKGHNELEPVKKDRRASLKSLNKKYSRAVDDKISNDSNASDEKNCDKNVGENKADDAEFILSIDISNVPAFDGTLSDPINENKNVTSSIWQNSTQFSIIHGQETSW